MLLSSMRGQKKKNTQKAEHGRKALSREGGHYVGCYERDGEPRKENRQTQREPQARMPIKVLTVCCAQQSTHCMERRQSQEKTDCLLKKRWGRGVV